MSRDRRRFRYRRKTRRRGRRRLLRLRDGVDAWTGSAPPDQPDMADIHGGGGDAIPDDPSRQDDLLPPYRFRSRCAAAEIHARSFRRCLQTGDTAAVGDFGGHLRARQNIDAPLREPGLLTVRTRLASLGPPFRPTLLRDAEFLTSATLILVDAVIRYLQPVV